MFTIRTLNTGQDPKFSRFFQKKVTRNVKLKKSGNLGTFTQKVLFLDYNKTKKKCDNLGSWTVILEKICYCNLTIVLSYKS